MQTKKYAIDVHGNDQDKEWEFADQIDFICYMRDLRGVLGLTNLKLLRFILTTGTLSYTQTTLHSPLFDKNQRAF